jgi:hypothetical protein
MAIQISGSKQNDTFNAAYRIANHLLRFYKDSVLAACETQKVPREELLAKVNGN